MKEIRWLAATAVLIPLAGCGESTDVPLAKVPPVAPSTAAPKPTPAPKGAPRSPDVLPGSSQ